MKLLSDMYTSNQGTPLELYDQFPYKLKILLRETYTIHNPSVFDWFHFTYHHLLIPNKSPKQQFLKYIFIKI